MKVDVGAATDIGQVREGNEDSYLVVAPLYAVADGMGGHRGGEVASTLALQTVQQLFESGEGTLAQQVTEANRAVFDRSRSDRSVSGMGTTLTAALIDVDRVHLVHVGDSRAYLLRRGELTQLTEDHTLVHRMVMEGEISQEEAETHPHRSILTRALGVDPNVQIDEGDVEVVDGDRLLLCTDGLTGMVPEGQIRDILTENADPQEAVDRLVTVANRAGGVDNITAVILDFSDDGDARARGDTKEAAVPRRPTPEQPISAPAERSDITDVGAPTPDPPAETLTSATRSQALARRPAPSARGRSRWRRVGIWAAVTLAVIVLAAVGLRFYLDRQWFVGVSSGRVAIFRGIPTEVAGVDLHTVVVETDIPASGAQTLALYRDLPDGITADDRAGAEQIVEQIRTDIADVAQPAS